MAGVMPVMSTPVLEPEMGVAWLAMTKGGVAEAVEMAAEEEGLMAASKPREKY